MAKASQNAYSALALLLLPWPKRFDQNYNFGVCHAESAEAK
jgi:hypothetical protein